MAKLLLPLDNRTFFHESPLKSCDLNLNQHEAVYQDFWSTVFISNPEAIMTKEVTASLNSSKAEENKVLKINKAVSFNAIKNMAFELFIIEPDKEKVFNKLMRLFVMNPATVRENKSMLRKDISNTQSLNFQNRVSRNVF